MTREARAGDFRIARSSRNIERMFELRAAPSLSVNQEVPTDWPVRMDCAEAPGPGDPHSTYSWSVLVEVRGGQWREGTVWAWTWSWNTDVWRCQLEILGVVRWYRYDHRHLRKVARLAPRSPVPPSLADR